MAVGRIRGTLFPVMDVSFAGETTCGSGRWSESDSGCEIWVNGALAYLCSESQEYDLHVIEHSLNVLSETVFLG